MLIPIERMPAVRGCEKLSNSSWIRLPVSCGSVAEFGTFWDRDSAALKRLERLLRCLGIAFCQLSAKPFHFTSHECVIYVPLSTFLTLVFHLRIRWTDSTLSRDEGEEQPEITRKLIQMNAVIRRTMKPSTKAVGQQKY